MLDQLPDKRQGSWRIRGAFKGIRGRAGDASSAACGKAVDRGAAGARLRLDPTICWEYHLK